MIDLTPEEIALIQERRAAQLKEEKKPTSFFELLKAARRISSSTVAHDTVANSETPVCELQDWETGFIEPSPVPEPVPEPALQVEELQVEELQVEELQVEELQVEQKAHDWSDEWGDLWDDPLHDTLANRVQADGKEEPQEEGKEASSIETEPETSVEQEDAGEALLNDAQLAFPMWVLSLQGYEGDEYVDLTTFKEFFALKARVTAGLKAFKGEPSSIKRLARQIKKGTLPLRDVPLAFQVGEVGSKTQQRLIGSPLLLDLIFESWGQRLRSSQSLPQDQREQR